MENSRSSEISVPPLQFLLGPEMNKFCEKTNVLKNIKKKKEGKAIKENEENDINTSDGGRISA